MSDYLYSYTIDQFPNETYNLTKLSYEIGDSSIVTALDHLAGDVDQCDIYFKASLSLDDWATLSGVVAAHDGEELESDETFSVNITGSTEDISTVIDMPTDMSGKLRVHQTSRRFGTCILWTGIGDDIDDITKVGGGEPMTFVYNVGDSEPLIKYIDFNLIENQTFVHEGYMSWNNCLMDKLTSEVVTRAATISGVTGGDKALYGGYLVVPTASGYGNIEVTSDLTDPIGGLVYIPDGDQGEPPTGYWDADYNTTTKKFENIQPNYTGTGRYHIFSCEVVLSEFVREIPLLASGFLALNSSDTDEIGQGMRIKMIADTCTDVEDRDWQLACVLCLHRAKTC